MPAPSFRLLVGLCATPAPALQQAANLAFVHVHAVRGQHLGAEESLLLDIGNHRHAVLPPRLLDLEQRFGEMRVQRHVELRGQLGAGAQDVGRARVWRMRRRPRHDQGVPSPALDEVPREGERVLVADCIRRRKAQDRLAAQRAHAGVGGRFRDRLLEVVHVGEAGDAGANHLGAAKAGAESDEVRAHELTLDRQHVSHQPDVEAQVVSQPPEQRHRHVRVRIDEAGHHDPPAAVDGLPGGEGERIRTDRGDAVAGDRDPARCVNRERRIDGQDGGVGQQEIAVGRHSTRVAPWFWVELGVLGFHTRENESSGSLLLVAGGRWSCCWSHST